RTAETLAAWLWQHPELEIVSRDRSGAYAEGIRQGAPQAVQVADRFHVHKNVTAALERYLTRKHTAVRQAARDGRAVDTPVTDEPPADAAPPLPRREPPERRAHRLARYEEVVALRACGASVRTIATRIGIGQRTVQRWLRAGRFPERRQRSERWAQGGHNATQLWQELRERGDTG